jgi:hypothetical protein
MLKHLKPSVSWWSMDAYLAMFDSARLDARGKIYRVFFLFFVVVNIVASFIH